VPRRLKLIWEDEALDDLAAAAEWSRLQAGHVVDAMESMAEIGWSLGRRSRLFPERFRYWPVPPLAVLYELQGTELRVLRVFDARRLRELP
jgi:plasmid stabilization system protein ParE